MRIVVFLKARDLGHLHPVKRQVSRKGKVFQQTFYVRGAEEEKPKREAKTEVAVLSKRQQEVSEEILRETGNAYEMVVIETASGRVIKERGVKDRVSFSMGAIWAAIDKHPENYGKPILFMHNHPGSGGPHSPRDIEVAYSMAYDNGSPVVCIVTTGIGKHYRITVDSSVFDDVPPGTPKERLRGAERVMIGLMEPGIPKANRDRMHELQELVHKLFSDTVENTCKEMGVERASLTNPEAEIYKKVEKRFTHEKWSEALMSIAGKLKVLGVTYEEI